MEEAEETVERHDGVAPPEDLGEDGSARRVVLQRYVEQNTEQWLGCRKPYEANGLCGSECSAVLGYGSESVHFLWEKKVKGKKRVPPPFVQEMMDNGHRDEPVLVERLRQVWKKHLELQLGKLDTTDWFCSGLFQHPEHDWLAASPDRRVWWRDSKEWWLVEAKSRQMDNFARTPTMNQWIQMQVQMQCCEVDVCLYVCANVQYDETVVCLVRRSDRFWELAKDELERFVLFQVREKREPDKRRKQKTNFHSAYRKSVSQLWPLPMCGAVECLQEK